MFNLIALLVTLVLLVGGMCYVGWRSDVAARRFARDPQHPSRYCSYPRACECRDCEAVAHAEAMEAEYLATYSPYRVE